MANLNHVCLMKNLLLIRTLVKGEGWGKRFLKR